MSRRGAAKAATKQIEWIGLREAAGLLGVSYSVMHRLVASGEIVHRKRGLRIKEVRRSDVLRRLEPLA